MNQRPTDPFLRFPKFKVIRDDKGLDLIGVERSDENDPAYPLLRQLVQAGSAGGDLGPLALRTDVIWSEASSEADAIDYLSDLLGMRPFMGAVYIDFNGDFASAGCQFTMRFPSRFTALGPTEFLETVLRDPFLEQGGADYFLTPDLRSLTLLLDEANSRWSTLGMPERYGYLRRLKGLASNGGFQLSPFLRSTQVGATLKPIIDVEAIPGTDRARVTIDSEVDGVDGARLRASIEKNGTVPQVYTLNGADGSYTKVLVDPNHRKYIDFAKKHQNLTPEDLGSLIQSPPEAWNDDEVDLSGLYSDRVIGLGVFKARATPYVTQYKSEWIPGLEIEGYPPGDFLIRTIEDLQNLEVAYGEAEQNNRDQVRVGAYLLPLPDARNIIGVARTQFANREAGAAPDPAVRKKLSVLIKTNLEDEEYEEKVSPIPDAFPLVPVPGLAADFSLKSYQQQGVDWIIGLIDSGIGGGILADDMGLGKTLQVLAAMQVCASRGAGFLGLLVSPVSLLQNWQAEMRKFFPNTGIEIIVANENPGLVENLLRHRERYADCLVLTSYEFLRINNTKFAVVDWTLVVLDEAQTVKNPTTLVTTAAKALKAKFKLAITGTPVENSFVDLWCLVDFVAPNFLGSAKEFTKTFGAKQDDDEEEIVRKGQELGDRLGNLLLRRLKTDVLQDLPMKIEHVDDAMEVMPSGQQSAYDQLLYSARSRPEGSRVTTLEVISQLRKLSDHPLVLDRSAEWMDDADVAAAKLLVLRQILDRVKVFNEKCLIFAEFRTTQQILARVLRQWFEIDVEIINGDSPTGSTKVNSRVSVINRFLDCPGFGVLILSPRAAGVGLNITGANHVVHYSRHWNPAKEEQATDRAYRIGQVKEVHVWYPTSLHSNSAIKTFDQNLAELLSHKKTLKGAVLYPTARFEASPDELFRSVVDGDERT